MSGDFEPWNNSPVSDEKPKQEEPLTLGHPKHQSSRVIIWIDILAGIAAIGLVLWYLFYRH